VRTARRALRCWGFGILLRVGYSEASLENHSATARVQGRGNLSHLFMDGVSHMSKWLTFVCSAATVLTMMTAAAFAADKDYVLDHKMKSLAGKDVDLNAYKGKVVLVVNVASKCGLTPQYKQLEALHEKYGEDGLAVVGFPSNQFGSQEPGTAAEISEFCTTKYGVKFDMMAKIDVNGDEAAPLYKQLTATDTEPAKKGDISWNFEKFLINKDGKVVARFAPRTKPDADEVVAKIEEELKK
jgi:glutathione peroxidase